MLIKRKKHGILAILAVAVVIAWIYIVILNSNKPQELPQQTTSQPNTETIILSPTTRSYAVGQPLLLTFAVPVSNTPIDGFQLVADITGTVPNNLSFHAASLSAVTCIRNLITTTNTGKRLEFACITQNPQTPITTRSIVVVGSMTGTVSEVGAMTISWNTTLTKISENKTAADIAGMPQQTTYTFLPAPTPTPQHK